MSKKFSYGTRIRDILGQPGVVVGCVDSLVMLVMDEPYRYDDGQRHIAVTYKQHVYHDDDEGEKLGEWEAVSHDMWWGTYPDEIEGEEAEFQESHRIAVNKAIRMAAPDTGKERKV